VTHATCRRGAGSKRKDGRYPQRRFLTRVSLFASRFVRYPPGYFTFEECGDEVNPTIGVEVGVTYTFLQVRECRRMTSAR
jgi:hypothetical protein